MMHVSLLFMKRLNKKNMKLPRICNNNKAHTRHRRRREEKSTNNDKIQRYSCNIRYTKKKNWPRGHKTFYMLNSAEHEFFSANKYKFFMLSYV